MQTEHEADELPALLREEYGAPPLDKQFSTNLVARLQAEVAAAPPASSTPAHPRRLPLAICVAIAAVAASVIAVVWISSGGTPATSYNLAQRTKSDSDRLDLLALSDQGKESREYARADPRSAGPRTMKLSESLVQREHESLASSERKPYSESRAQESIPTQESINTLESKLSTLSSNLTVLSKEQRDWPDIAGAAALADLLYVVDSGRLYEVNPQDGLRRSVGSDNWPSAAALAAAGEYLYIVSERQLYEVNPKTGTRRSLGKPEWAHTKAILTVGGQLYIASNGLLHRVDPNDGSREVLHSKNANPDQPLQLKP